MIDTAIATVVIGVGVIGMVKLLAAGTMSNIAGTELTTAVNLANNIHEVALGLAFVDPEQPGARATKEGSVASYDDLLDLDGDTYSPPLDCRRQPIAAYATWSQAVAVQTVAADNVASVRPNDLTVPMARVTVTIRHNGKNVYATSWLVAAPNPPAAPASGG